MTAHSIIVLSILGISLLLWTLNLVRQGRLYVGYGAACTVLIMITLITVLLPEMVWDTLPRLVGVIFPIPALMVLVFFFFILILVYILTQLTIIADRLATVVQEMAILKAQDEASRQSGQNERLSNSSTQLTESVKLENNHGNVGI